MASIAEQKSNLRQCIHNLIDRRLNDDMENGDGVVCFNTAVGAIRRLSAKMTLKELEAWHSTLVLAEMTRETGG